MKKHILAFLVCALLGWGEAQAMSGDTLQLVLVQSHATLPVEKSFVEYSVRAQLPLENSETLQQSILKWTAGKINDMIGDSASVYSNDAEGLLSSKIQRAYMKRSASEIEEYYALARKEKEKNPHAMNYLFDLNLKKVYETKGYITYLLQGETYSGGAHGMHWSEYATFNIRTGKTLTWSDVIQSKQKSKFSSAVADGLLRYFGVQTFKDMKDRLMIEGSSSRTQFPLPKTLPAFLSDGLRVQYQYYEIAPYALGAPSCTLPYATALKFLTQTGKNVLRK